MIDLHDWWKVVDDLSKKHDLNERRKAELERQIIVALFQGWIPPLDKHGKLISHALTLSRDKQCVWVRVSDVNKYLFDVNPKFVWEPRKKQGRPVSTCSLEAHRASGKLKIDAIKAASQFKGNTGRIPHRFHVANRLAKNFPDYGNYKASYIEKKLRTGWWN
jgi:hypothetical protein